MFDFYQKIYKLFEGVTPLLVDCGELCQAACCNKEVGEGVYLFPGEECMFETLPLDWIITEKNDRKILNCHGVCSREHRPLFCRIFPLFPYIDTDGNVMLEYYLPMALICPLVKLRDDELIADDFFDVMDEVAALLAENPVTRPFVEKISREIDVYENEEWTKLI